MTRANRAGLLRAGNPPNPHRDKIYRGRFDNRWRFETTPAPRQGGKRLFDKTAAPPTIWRQHRPIRADCCRRKATPQQQYAAENNTTAGQPPAQAAAPPKSGGHHRPTASSAWAAAPRPAPLSTAAKRPRLSIRPHRCPHPRRPAKAADLAPQAAPRRASDIYQNVNYAKIPLKILQKFKNSPKILQNIPKSYFIKVAIPPANHGKFGRTPRPSAAS